MIRQNWTAFYPERITNYWGPILLQISKISCFLPATNLSARGLIAKEYKYLTYYSWISYDTYRGAFWISVTKE